MEINNTQSNSSAMVNAEKRLVTPWCSINEKLPWSSPDMLTEPAVWCLNSWLEVESPTQKNGKKFNNEMLLLSKKTWEKIFVIKGVGAHGSCVSWGGGGVLHVGAWNKNTTTWGIWNDSLGSGKTMNLMGCEEMALSILSRIAEWWPWWWRYW